MERAPRREVKAHATSSGVMTLEVACGSPGSTHGDRPRAFGRGLVAASAPCWRRCRWSRRTASANIASADQPPTQPDTCSTRTRAVCRVRSRRTASSSTEARAISSQVRGVPSDAGVRSHGGCCRPRLVCVPPSSRRPWASQTGDHTFTLVGRDWKPVQAEANRRRGDLDRPTPRDRACT